MHQELLYLEDFGAEAAFDLSGGVRFRTITQPELTEFSERFDGGRHRRMGLMSNILKSDAWICELTENGPKGSPEAHNKLIPLQRNIELALVVFQTGPLSLRFNDFTISGAA